MIYSVKHPYDLDPLNGIEIEVAVVRLRWTQDSNVFQRNTFVAFKVIGSKKKVYRILKGASTESISGSELLVSYGTYKYLEAKKDSVLNIEKSNPWERNVLFYLNHPDPRQRHRLVRDFVVTVTGFIVSIIQILQYFGI